ncbi:hypothetical protein KBB96_07010 [Luteolibacter ambystomatis]|uniref:Uncharacterized protein n=1 Tax=Luteolibacter ambystomatis TaxID=2824561 RepID=A0A975J277_9BACT|nr:hypothetical protein [Luteolibacter ambystomatis]QUE52637.1 hypothetical protein KBB96_07010 [Luteolibacter ambystomatis]
MNNPFTCDNCIFNPSQYQELGTRHGFCLKHGSILKHSSHTTCRFLRRKDLPYFLAEEGHKEHASNFSTTKGIVFYWNKHPEEHQNYSEKHAWETRTFDPFLNDVTIYHRTLKKWTFLQALASGRSAVKSVVYSSLLRRYIHRCGPSQDNYRLMLGLTASLADRIDLEISDFRSDVQAEEFMELRDCYEREIILLRIYAIQEYGFLSENEDLTWVSDELNGSFLNSIQEYLDAARNLVPIIQEWIISASKERGTFFFRNDEAD